MKRNKALVELREFFEAKRDELNKKVPSSDRACMVAMYMIAYSNIAAAACDYCEPDSDWIKILMCLEKIDPTLKELSMSAEKVDEEAHPKE